MTAPDLILTLNRRFAPSADDDSYAFGVVGFITAVAKALAARDQLAGVILYERAIGTAAPGLRAASFLGMPACHLTFGVARPDRALRAALGGAVAMLSRPRVVAGRRRPTVIYHQTNTLLPMTPRAVPAMVTHHAPFAAEISRRFGPEIARDAFQGDGGKVRYLLDAQARGLDYLRRSTHCPAMEMSGVQAAILRRAGVRTVAHLPPPIDVPEARSAGSLAVSSGPLDELHLVSATARLDAFKNMPLLVHAVNRLAAWSIPVRLTLFVATTEDDASREALRSRLAPRVAARTRIDARLPHRQLLDWMAEQRGTAIFVCPSRYETLGITPLEAILSGMTTLVPDDPCVGVAEYVDPAFRFTPTVEGLVARLIDIRQRADLAACGQRQRAHAVRLTGIARCVDTVCAIARRVGRAAEDEAGRGDADEIGVRDRTAAASMADTEATGIVP